MLVDKEQHVVRIEPNCNHHQVVLGKPGYGKTYFCAQEIAKLLEERIPVVVLDWSCSYTKVEIKKNRLDLDLCKVYDVKNEKVYFMAGASEEEVIDNVTDALSVTLGIVSFTQCSALREVCESIMRKAHHIQMDELINELMVVYENSDEPDFRKNINHLIRRLSPVKKVRNLQIIVGNQIYDSGLYIYQISHLGIKARNILSQFLIELLWQNIRNHDEQRIQLIFDEIQDLKILDTAVEELIRESRRKGVGVTMLTQFVPNSEVLDLLEQAETRVYFRPNDRSLSTLARRIDWDNWLEWREILKSLQQGECVVIGNCMVDGRLIKNQKPLICKVLAEIMSKIERENNLNTQDDYKKVKEKVTE